MSYQVNVHHVSGKRATFRVSSLRAAADTVIAWQAATGAGASDLTSDHGRVVGDGGDSYRVSYNGCVWDSSGRPVSVRGG